MIGKCHKCGNTVFSHKSKCSSCGATIDPQVFIEYNKPPEPPKPLTKSEIKARNRKLNFLIVLGVIMFVALIVALVTSVWGFFFDGSINVLTVSVVSWVVFLLIFLIVWKIEGWTDQIK